MSILKSALKSYTPANRAFVKHTKIDETIEFVEDSVADSVPWHKQFLLSGGDYGNVVDGPVRKEHRDKSIRAYATARFATIQFASGQWKNPITWLSKSALRLEAADNFAPYGRRLGKAHEGVNTVSITRRAALHYSEVTALDFENIGDSPFLSGCFLIFVGEPKRVANTDGNIAASA